MKKLYIALRRNYLIAGIAAFLLLPLADHADAKEGHPLLGALTGYEVYRRDVTEDSSLTLTRGEINHPRAKKYAGPLQFSGKITKLDYRVSSGHQKISAGGVYQELAKAVRSLGGKPLTDRQDADNDYEWNIFEVPRSGSEIIYVLQKSGSSGYYSLVIVEPKFSGATIKAGELAQQLHADGVATLYIEFDTNATVLKVDGVAAVKEIAQLMKQDPKLKLSVEGHTDNVGAASANRALALARAQEVVKAVIAEGIDRARLSAKGHGPDIPIADNRKEEGRAKNRRVELVKVSS